MFANKFGMAKIADSHLLLNFLLTDIYKRNNAQISVSSIPIAFSVRSLLEITSVAPLRPEKSHAFPVENASNTPRLLMVMELDHLGQTKQRVITGLVEVTTRTPRYTLLVHVDQSAGYTLRMIGVIAILKPPAT
jgi:hypothetical protein